MIQIYHTHFREYQFRDLLAGELNWVEESEPSIEWVLNALNMISLRDVSDHKTFTSMYQFDSKGAVLLKLFR